MQLAWCKPVVEWNEKTWLQDFNKWTIEEFKATSFVHLLSTYTKELFKNALVTAENTITCLMCKKNYTLGKCKIFLDFFVA